MAGHGKKNIMIKATSAITIASMLSAITTYILLGITRTPYRGYRKSKFRGACLAGQRVSPKFRYRILSTPAIVMPIASAVCALVLPASECRQICSKRSRDLAFCATAPLACRIVRISPALPLELLAYVNIGKSIDSLPISHAFIPTTPQSAHIAHKAYTDHSDQTQEIVHHPSPKIWLMIAVT